MRPPDLPSLSASRNFHEALSHPSDLTEIAWVFREAPWEFREASWKFREAKGSGTQAFTENRMIFLLIPLKE